jgi:glycosyltransferase involved in cell wall biosynthesis
VTPRLDYVDEEALPEGVRLHTFRHHLHGTARSVPKLGWLIDTLAWFTFGWSAWPIVRRLCARGDIDLLYGYEIYGVPVAARAARTYGIPLVARYQGTLMSSRRHERLAGLRYYKHLSALRMPADLFVMTDDGTMGDEVLEALGHPAERIRFWMNGVDRGIVDSPKSGEEVRSELGIEAEAPLLLTVSRLSHWKRLDRAIDVASDLRERHGLPVELVVVGTGPEEAALRERARTSAAAGHVHFAGGVERDRLAGFYRAADALLSLYDYSNLANPVLEAMLLGTPVVALDVGGTSNLVVDQANGVLLDRPEPARIAETVAGLLREPSRLRDLGAKAGDWAEQNLWSWKERMDAEIRELECLLRSDPPC